MRVIRITSRFKKSLKKILKSGKVVKKEIQTVIEKLAYGGKIEIKYKDHALSGMLSEYRECHVRSDLLLVYKIENNDLILVLVNIGSHSDLF